MLDEEQLYQEIEELQQRWDSLFTHISELQEERDLETRVEDQQRQDKRLAEKNAELAAVDQLIKQRKPDNFMALQQRVWVTRADKYKQNDAYAKALDQWQQIIKAYPDNPEASRAIQVLQELINEKQNTRELVKQVMRRLKTIKPIYKQVISRLKNLSDSSNDQMLVDQVQLFVDGDLDAEEFMDSWELFADDDTNHQSDNIQIDYQRFAERITRGEMIIFLGSGVQREYNDLAVDESVLAASLAENINWQNHHHSLPSVAEYYDCRHDYGRDALLEQLQQTLPNALPTDKQTISLYQSLARIDRPLILIASAYDNLLEQSFRQQRKRFVEIYSISNPDSEITMGNVVLHYSDRDHPANAPNYAKDDLSQLDLLEQGYTLIYKIRGTCDSEECANSQTQADRQDALTIMESDYFNFARYSERIIPSYIAKQFRTREFLFIGFRPRYWEDRLLVNALLERRGNVRRKCLLIGEHHDEFEAAYWNNRQVQRYPISIRQLDDYLQAMEGKTA